MTRPREIYAGTSLAPSCMAVVPFLVRPSAPVEAEVGSFAAPAGPFDPGAARVHGRILD